jgi:chromosome segregation ATPase
MDELKETAEQNRHDLEALTGAIARAESNKADLNAQLEALKRLSSIDTEVVREALRIPTEVDKWKERIWGFVVGGVIAGLVATAVWELAIRPHAAG